MTSLPWATDRAAFRQLADRARYDWGAAWQPESWDVIDRHFTLHFSTLTEKVRHDWANKKPGDAACPRKGHDSTPSRAMPRLNTEHSHPKPFSDGL